MTAPSPWSHAIRAHLNATGMTQAAFAKQIHCSLNTIEKWLAGRYAPSATSQRILKRHGVTLNKYPLPREEQDR